MKRLLASLVALLLTTIAFAQKTDFSGTWNLKDQKSISGALYSNGVPKQIKITQAKDAFTLDMTTANAQGQDVTTTESLAFNGKKFESTTASKRKKSISITWDKEGKTFTRTSDLSQTTDTSKVEIRYTDKWSIDDGKLMLDRKAENFLNGETWESKSVYQKGE
jgi:hypothetical protein